MFWLYVPPIIFISALIALVVMFGKKTALLKKRGETFRSKKDRFPAKIESSERWKKILGLCLEVFGKNYSFGQNWNKKVRSGFIKSASQNEGKKTGEKNSRAACPGE